MSKDYVVVTRLKDGFRVIKEFETRLQAEYEIAWIKEQGRVWEEIYLAAVLQRHTPIIIA